MYDACLFCFVLLGLGRNRRKKKKTFCGHFLWCPPVGSHVLYLCAGTHFRRSLPSVFFLSFFSHWTEIIVNLLVVRRRIFFFGIFRVFAQLLESTQYTILCSIGPDGRLRYYWCFPGNDIRLMYIYFRENKQRFQQRWWKQVNNVVYYVRPTTMDTMKGQIAQENEPIACSVHVCWTWIWYLLDISNISIYCFESCCCTHLASSISLSHLVPPSIEPKAQSYTSSLCIITCACPCVRTNYFQSTHTVLIYMYIAYI